MAQAEEHRCYRSGWEAYVSRREEKFATTERAIKMIQTQYS